jgi:uncharacterized protein
MLRNVDVLRAGYEAFNRRDWDAFLKAFTEDVVLEQTGAVFDSQGRFEGHEGLMESQRELAEAWDELRYEPEEFLEDGDRILVLVRYSTRGRDSGIPFEATIGHLFTMRDGRVAHLKVFATPGEALRETGFARS